MNSPVKRRRRKSAAVKRSVGGILTDNRSRVTNGSRMLPGIDGRSAEARRFKDLYRGYLQRTNGKHDELCKQLAALVMQREILDGQLVNGEEIDPLNHARLSNAINRTMRLLGFIRHNDEPTPPTPIRDRLTEGAS